MKPSSYRCRACIICGWSGL